jgi:putative redox protein
MEPTLPRTRAAQMNKPLSVTVRQVGPTTGQGAVRHHSVLIDRPESKGGMDRGPMGGELIMLGLGGCFLSNLLAAIREREAPISDVEVTVSTHAEGTPPRMSSFELRVSAKHEDPELLQKIVTVAERGCIASNTLKQGSAISVVLESQEEVVPAETSASG